MFVELEKYTVNTNLIAMIEERVNTFGDPDYYLYIGSTNYSISRGDYDKLKAVFTPKPRRVKNSEVDTNLQQFFMKLHRLTGGNGTPVFNPAREKKLKDLMSKHKLTEEMLVKAATNIGNDEYLQGENDNKKRYGDIDYLLRPDKAMKWAEANPVSKKRGMFNG